MAFKDGPLVEETATPVNIAIVKDGFTRQDEADMAEQGKRQQFHRNFGFISMLGFTTTMMCTWEAVFLYVFTLISQLL